MARRYKEDAPDADYRERGDDWLKKAAIAELQIEINKEQKKKRDFKRALEHLSDEMSAIKGNESREVIG